MAFRAAADKLERIALSILSKKENQQIDDDGDINYSASIEIREREYSLSSHAGRTSVVIENADKMASVMFHFDERRDVDISVHGTFLQVPNFATAGNCEMNTINELTAKMEEYAAELWPSINSTSEISPNCLPLRFCNEDVDHLRILRLI